jgi:hypothetical protein
MCSRVTNVVLFTVAVIVGATIGASVAGVLASGATSAGE